tara:strand:+ start:339282 stop:340214 length:933 start_codon:yes stop_codon:yes gene_type:complete
MSSAPDSLKHTTLQVGPDFVIIGAMKCATSSVHDQLAMLEGVSMSDPKEPNFFSDEENWAMGLGWYESLFASMPVGDLKGESSTHYSKRPTYPRCARRLYDFVPSAKLIYIMRDPIERIVSQYIHEWSMQMFEKDCSIDDAIERYPILVDYSKYAMQLEPYIELFGTESVLPVFFERMKNDPDSELQRIASHVGYQGRVAWHEQEAQNVSSARQRRSPVLNKVLDVRLIQMARRSLLPESLRAKVRSRWTMNERPVLSDRSIAYLHEQLDPEMDRLGDLLGIKLNCQEFTQVVTRDAAPEWACVPGDSHE